MALRPQGRRNPFLTVAVVSSLAVLSGIGPAAAQITTMQEAPTIVEEEEPLPTFMIGLTGIGGFGTVDMLRMNEALAIANTEITQPGVRYKDFSRGGLAGGGIRAMIKERLIIEADFERFFMGQRIGGITASSEVNMPVDSYMMTVSWDMMKKRRVGFGLAAGVGRYQAGGEQVITETNVSNETTTLGTIKMQGNAWGTHIGGFFESALAGHVWMNVFAGYRSAHVDNLDITGLDELQEPELDQTRTIAALVVEEQADGNVTLRGAGDSLDWSGFMGRLALTWYFNSPVQ